jgi:hypothetical protein
MQTLVMLVLMDVNKINNELEKLDNKQPKSRTKLLAGLLALSLLIMVGLGAALMWAVWGKSPAPGSPDAGGSVSSAPAGPCFAGVNNDLPEGYTWYENASLGYKFAYPSAWGAVTFTDTPMGGVAGHFAQGSFAGNPNVTFGGNATDYVVNPRGGMPLDNPGYLQATNKFYQVQIWKLNEDGTHTPKYELYPIDEPTTLKDGCNVKAAVTQYPNSEFIGYAYDQARINLQPSNLYYGVNLVLKNPDATSRGDFDKVIKSFQLIP